MQSPRDLYGSYFENSGRCGVAVSCDTSHIFHALSDDVYSTTVLGTIIVHYTCSTTYWHATCAGDDSSSASGHGSNLSEEHSYPHRVPFACKWSKTIFLHATPRQVLSSGMGGPSRRLEHCGNGKGGTSCEVGVMQQTVDDGSTKVAPSVYMHVDRVTLKCVNN